MRAVIILHQISGQANLRMIGNRHIVPTAPIINIVASRARQAGKCPESLFARI
jgi:hypothetical protein